MPDFAVSTGFTAQDRISTAFRKMARFSSLFETRATKSFRNVGRAGARTGDIMKGILGADVIRRGFRLLTQGLRTAVTEFIGFDQAVTSASAKFKDLNLATEEGQRILEALKTTAREVGATTQFTASQAAEGLDFLALAGFNSAQAMASLSKTVDLATVGQVDLGRATDIATDTLGAFNLMTTDTVQLQKNLTRVNDVMSRTMTRTNQTIDQTFEAIAKGAPSFTAAGQSMETFNALLGPMADAAVKGGEAGTALRNVMLRLANPVKEAQTVLDDLNIVTADSRGNFRDVIDILADFETGLKGMGTQQRTAALATVFGARTVTGINILLARGSENLREFRTELENSAGATQQMADIIRSSLQNRLASLRSAAIETGFKFIQAFEKDGGGAIELLTEKIRQFDVQPIVEGVGKAIEIIKKWGPVLFDLAPMILGAAAAIKVMNIAMNASPIGIFLTTAAALVGSLGLLEKKFGFSAKISEEFGGSIGTAEFEEGRRERLAKRRATEAETRAQESSQTAEIISRLQADINLSLPPGLIPAVQTTGTSRNININLLGQN